MAHSLQQDPLLNAFRAIANADAPIPPHYLTALHVAVRRFAGRMWLAGRPIERVVAHIKSMAAEAGVRESHDQLVDDAVEWAVTYFRGGSSLEPPSPALHTPSRRTPSRRSSDREVPLEVGIDSLSWVIEELDRHGPQSNVQSGERREELGR
jgi:hypothetical protein